MKTLILALGNPILSDDRVGWEIADRLATCLPADAFDILKESGATFDLVRRISEYDRLILIDAIQLGTAPLGTLHRFTLEDFQSSIRYSSAHDINFATALDMGRQMGYRIPTDIRIYGVEVKELRRFSESLTPEIAGKLDKLAEIILQDVTLSRPRQSTDC